MLAKVRVVMAEQDTSDEGVPEVTVSRSEKAATPIVDLSSSQLTDSGYEMVDSTGIAKEMESAASLKKRGKKGKK